MKKYIDIIQFILLWRWAQFGMLRMFSKSAIQTDMTSFSSHSLKIHEPFKICPFICIFSWSKCLVSAWWQGEQHTPWFTFQSEILHVLNSCNLISIGFMPCHKLFNTWSKNQVPLLTSHLVKFCQCYCYFRLKHRYVFYIVELLTWMNHNKIDDLKCNCLNWFGA